MWKSKNTFFLKTKYFINQSSLMMIVCTATKIQTMECYTTCHQAKQLKHAHEIAAITANLNQSL